MTRHTPPTLRQIKAAIVKSLSPDLLTPQYRALLRAGDPAVTGHCAVATEALYHISGGRMAGYIPVVASFEEDGERMTHWWLRAPSADGLRGMGAIVDVTAAQFPDGFDYTHGRNTGFMQPQQLPSKRAAVVIGRVEEKLGKENIAAYRAAQIEKYAASQRKTRTKTSTPKPGK